MHTLRLWGHFEGDAQGYQSDVDTVAGKDPLPAYESALRASGVLDDDAVEKAKPWMAKNPRSVGPVPEGDYEVPIGRANVVRSGHDVSIVTLSLSVHHALDVAEELATEGVDCEVVDLRGLVPLDTDTILESVGRTGRLLVVDEDYLSFGLSGEVVARVVERDPGLLRAPARRVAVPDVPIPYARPLEYAVLPTTTRIRARRSWTWCTRD